MYSLYLVRVDFFDYSTIMGGVKDSSSAQYSCFWKHQQQANVRFHIDNSVSAQ